MKRFVDPATQEAFCATLVKGPGMGFTLSLHTSSTNGMPRVSRHLFVPPAKAAEGLRAYNRPHRPEMLIRFAEGLLPLPTPIEQMVGGVGLLDDDPRHHEGFSEGLT
jgi:hypothetical protein